MRSSCGGVWQGSLDAETWRSVVSLFLPPAPHFSKTPKIMNQKYGLENPGTQTFYPLESCVRFRSLGLLVFEEEAADTTAAGTRS
ncbi:unnamed protein product [Ectocarpus sp. 8 AP-2014]